MTTSAFHCQRHSHWAALSEIWYGRRKKLKFGYNRTKILRTARDVASQFILQTAGRSVMLLDNRADGTHLAFLFLNVLLTVQHLSIFNALSI